MNLAISTLIEWGIPLICILLALLSISYGLQQFRRATVIASQQHTSDANRRSPSLIPSTLLILSTLSWLGLATAFNSWTAQNQHPTIVPVLTASDLNQLPATSAGEPMFISHAPRVIDPAPASDIAKTANFAEELTESMQNIDLRKLRRHVYQLLYGSQQFLEGAPIVAINLLHDQHRETIKYLGDEKPGLLTIIHQDGRNAGVVVYVPQIVGDQLLYTSISSASAMNRATPSYSSNPK
ncbi:hypothetical protein OLMES_0068 [Oleiphilus messinensis]|uniref:Uncharacterized protein n=1 Tax=Oleiphilus messinensis TaxID=141451 RepID=A0A1Y0I145_9GAMM|nr:hypothetical protein [Oleiphilus messinensis]ARU54177.1 hypothetical protein OLMES_0068 [Oleiphilus messinensis]